MLKTSTELGPYGLLARWILGHRRLVAVSALLLGVLAVLIGVPPKVDSNLLTLLPEDNASAAALMKLHEEEGGFNLLTLAYTSEDLSLIHI